MQEKGGKKKKIDIAALRENQAEEGEVMEQRYRKIRRRMNSVRRECLGYDRHSRRYWLCGVEDTASIGSTVERTCIMIEPFSNEHCITGKNLQLVSGKGAKGWEVVRTPQELKNLIETLSKRGIREYPLR
jgi:hypothetical protein